MGQGAGVLSRESPLIVVVGPLRLCPRALTGVVVAMLAASTSTAQVVTRVDLDNDAFNFWQPPARRADREYTQGTRVGVLWATGTALARRLLGATQQCADGAAFDCRLLSLAIQQSIYTPTLSKLRRVAGERPFAGWLGLEVGVRRESPRGMTAYTVSVGVTGKPSLAESAQKAVHEFFGFQPPQGWETQLPTEATLTASYRGVRDVVHLTGARGGALQFVMSPVWDVRAGTMATDATGGLQIALGVRPPGPWRLAARDASVGWGMYLVAGATESVVGRNLFLDGTTFSGSPRVTRNRFNGATEIGVGVRGPRGVVEWRVHSQGREYAGQPLAHAYSTFAFTVH
jgi:lipid A 3-O-deacylase